MMSSVRLTVVTTWYPSREDPVEGVFVARHVEALRRDHDVAVVHLAARPGTAEDPAVQRVVVDRRRPASLLTGLRAVREHLAGADALHTHVFSTLVLLSPLLLRRGAGRAPWLHSEHWSGVSDPVSGGPVWRRLAAARRLLGGPDAATAVSGYLAEAVRAARRDRTCHVVPNVVPAPARVRPRRRGEGLRLLSVGNLREVKDPLLAVATLAELRARGHDATLRWVGDGPLRAAVEQRARSLGVAEHLTLRGRLAPAAFAGEWPACDVFLLPSRYETFCVAGAEALAHGRPAVLGARGGARDFAGPGTHLVGERAVGAWADAVEAAAAGDVPAERIAAPVAARFSTGAVADAFGPVLRGVAARSTRRAPS
jgi:glycosyltransferase involved in cell wall biosynthesis